MPFRPDALITALPDSLAPALQARAGEWDAAASTRRLLERDATLWTGADEARWLGWLDAADDARAQLPRLARYAARVRAGGCSHALLAGMGGSSMFPEVLARVIGAAPGFPSLAVIDSTDPRQIATVERGLDLARTMVVVASKSGSTIEPNLLADHFLARVRAAVGAQAAGERFVAITDPGSSLERRAREEGFGDVFHGEPTIGGRYSALSAFGLVPAAMLGIDLQRFVDAAAAMRARCAADAALANPAVALGLAIAHASDRGRDKLTLTMSPGIAPLGAWIEQLVAESLGKHGVGVVPVDGEPLGEPRDYGDDRLFVRIELDAERDAAIDAALDALAAAGHPVLRIVLADRDALACEVFRWSMATAVVGAQLRVNPFDQPDVESAKVAARGLLSDFEARGTLGEDAPSARAPGIALFAPPGAGGGQDAQALLAGCLGTLGAGDYLGLLAFIEMNEAHAAALDRVRLAVRGARRVATTVGFGPRYLHSSGQMHKGGPASGVFLVITCDAFADLPVPGRKASFGVVELAQARGDFAVLAQRGRRVLRVHLHGDVQGGLARLEAMVRDALRG